MKPEDQNKAICEWLGIMYHKPTEEEIKSGSYYQYEPDYLNDLNAIHEAESHLLNQRMKLSDCGHPDLVGYPFPYMMHLCSVVLGQQAPAFPQTPEEALLVSRATAAQRAEALLRTIGKWQDSTLHTKG